MYVCMYIYIRSIGGGMYHTLDENCHEATSYVGGQAGLAGTLSFSSDFISWTADEAVEVAVKI